MLSEKHDTILRIIYKMPYRHAMPSHYTLTIAKKVIEVAPFDYCDIPARLTYLYGSSYKYLEDIGFDMKNFPPYEEIEKASQAQCVLYANTGLFSRAVGRLEGKTIALCNLEPHLSNGYLDAHFHIVDPALRFQGLGAPILNTALKLLYEKHRFTLLYIEPRKTNIPMNRLMQKLKFKHCKDYVSKTHPMAQEMEVSQYEVTAEQIIHNFHQHISEQNV
jgi:RimJ/RimL family protein N-acetyltransferase